MTKLKYGDLMLLERDFVKSVILVGVNVLSIWWIISTVASGQFN